MSRIKKVEYNGEIYDSRLESNHAFYLNAHPKITVLERQHKFLLLEGFEWFDIEKNKMRKARDMVYTCDFIIKHEDYDKPIVWESKGYARKDYKIRAKLFNMKYRDKYYFVEIHSMKQARDLFGELNEKV